MVNKFRKQKRHAMHFLKPQINPPKNDLLKPASHFVEFAFHSLFFFLFFLFIKNFSLICCLIFSYQPFYWKKKACACNRLVLLFSFWIFAAEKIVRILCVEQWNKNNKKKKRRRRRRIEWWKQILCRFEHCHSNGALQSTTGQTLLKHLFK